MCEMLVVEIYGSDSNEKAVDHIRVTSTSDFSIGYLERAAGGGAPELAPGRRARR